MTAVSFRSFLAMIVMSVLLLLPQLAMAHCDSMDGPVVKAAKLAVKTSNVTPVLKWVPILCRAQKEPERPADNPPACSPVPPSSLPARSRRTEQSTYPGK